jgi:hypothetical protein
MHLTRNQAYLHGYRGFKSLSLRHVTVSDRTGVVTWKQWREMDYIPPVGTGLL